MRIGVLQHAAFEGPGEIGVWAIKRGHTLSVSHLYRGDELPELDSFDLLLVMGGEMNIYQYRDWPWLKAESAFIRTALEQGKRAVGICLGAQFIADALGAGVVQNPEIELGWLPVTWTSEARVAFPELPAQATVLHWHGDTFGLPPGATRLASSAGCAEQGYLVPGKCLGLQFHLEVDPGLTKEFTQGQTEWPKGKYVQTREVVLKDAAIHHEANRKYLWGMLDSFCK
jgi:GMP synthase (glutamine-hydrolysing)